MLKFLKTKLAPILLAGALAATIVPSAMLALSDNENTAGAATEETAEETSETTAETTAEEVVELEEEADVETDEETLDASTAAYFEKNINTKYTDYDKFEIANFMIVKQTIADKSCMSGEKTIDALYESDDSMYAMITTIPAAVSVYDLSDGSDYYVAYANTMINDSGYEATDAVFAVYNNQGETVDGCVYDYDTGLAYIPKDLYEVDGETYAEYIQVQFLQVTKEDVADMESSVEVSLDDGETVETGEDSVSAFSFETSVETEKGLDEDDMVVTVNGVPTEDFDYDSDAGVVTVAESSLAVQSISVKTAEDETLVSKIKDAVGGAAEEASAYTAYTAKTMKTLGKVSLTNIETSALPGKFFKGNIGVYYTTSATATPPGASKEYTYYPSGVFQTVNQLLDADNYTKILSSDLYSLSDLGMTWSEINFGMDFEEAIFKRKTISGSNTVSDATGKIEVESVATKAAAYCAHISQSGNQTEVESDNLKRFNALVNSGADAEGGSANSWGEEAVVLRVLSTITVDSKDYMIVGVVTDNVCTQQGYGVFKFQITGEDTPPSVSLNVIKKSADTSDTSKKLKGTTFTFYNEYSTSNGLKSRIGNANRKANQKYTTATDDYGRYQWTLQNNISADTGYYYVQETSVPDGYELDSTIYRIGVKIQKQTSGTYNGWYKYQVTAKKLNSNNKWSYYKKANVQFAKKKVQNGASQSNGGATATVYFKIKDGKYKVNGGGEVNISADNLCAVITFLNPPNDLYGYLDVFKKSSNESITDGNDCYSLAGAEYLVYTSSDCSTQATDADGNKVSFVMDENGNSEDGPVAFNMGSNSSITYYIKESTTNYGTNYFLDSTVYSATVTSGSTQSEPVLLNVTNTPASDPVEILLKKTSTKGEDSDFDLSGAVYKIAYYDTTDASADLTSMEAAATWYLETDDEGRILFTSSYLASGYDSSDFYYDDDGDSCIPVGRIAVQEVVAPDDFYLDETVYTATITKTSSTTAELTWDDADVDSDSYLVIPSTSSDPAQHEEVPVPVIETLASDTATNDHVGVAAEGASIVDTVTYKWLDEGTTYILKGELVDTEGNVYGTTEKEFTVTDEDGCGTVTMPEIVFDATDLGGVTLYVNEYLYVSGEDEPLLSHDSAADLEYDQSITFVGAHTTAADITTDEKEGTATEDAQIVDDVECSGLIIGKSYTLTGTVHYKEDFTDINGDTHKAGDEIEATLVEAYYGENSLEIDDGKVTFTAEDDEATIRMIYSVDGTLLTGAGVVAVLTVNEFKRTGYTFDGWNMAKGGSGDSYGKKS